MKIGVIGLGLIGGSIFKRLRLSGYDVLGISFSQRGEGICSDYNELKGCNIVFVASPMHAVPAILDRLSEILPQDTIVTDVCSLKEFVTKKSYPFRFIPSHPMAGTEFSGYENSFPELFEGAKWVITPINNFDTQPLENLIKEMGATPVYTTPEEHDRAAALISHAPLVLAQALYLTAADNPLALKLASSGFRDMTRLAGSNPDMAVDMVNLNHKNIEQSLLKLYSAIDELLKNYDKDKISEIAAIRKQMYDSNGKNVL